MESNRGARRAAIYLRVSNVELQADTASPVEQEMDCRRLAEARGYVVVKVYKEIEKYKVGNRMVEPSATRSDRPQLRQMLHDADNRQFDVLLVWREDRLYRGVTKATLEVSDRVKQGVMMIELVHGTYNPDFAPVMAWAAGVELEAKRVRHAMGVKARLKAGKHWGPRAPYGYDYNAEIGKFVPNAEEAYYVRMMKEMYAKGIPVLEIRRWLITSGAKQKAYRDSVRITQWAATIIRKIIHEGFYASGIKVVDWDGEQFISEIEPIVTKELQAEVDRRAEVRRKTMVRRLNPGPYIFVGKVYCGADDAKTEFQRSVSRRADGTRVEFTYYRCCYYQRHQESPNCMRGVTADAVEYLAWKKIWAVISAPGNLESLIQTRVAQLAGDQSELQTSIERIKNRLVELEQEKQRVYNWARKNLISEDDMAAQIQQISIEYGELKNDLAADELAAKRDFADVIASLQYVQDNIARAVEALRYPPRDEEEARHQQSVKQWVVDSFIQKVKVWKLGKAYGHPKGDEYEKYIRVEVEGSIEPELFVTSTEASRGTLTKTGRGIFEIAIESFESCLHTAIR